MTSSVSLKTVIKVFNGRYIYNTSSYMITSLSNVNQWNKNKVIHAIYYFALADGTEVYTNANKRKALYR